MTTPISAAELSALLASSPDAEYVFQERLGIAVDNGMSVEEGSPAWMIAAEEAMREVRK